MEMRTFLAIALPLAAATPPLPPLAPPTPAVGGICDPLSSAYDSKACEDIEIIASPPSPPPPTIPPPQSPPLPPESPASPPVPVAAAGFFDVIFEVNVASDTFDGPSFETALAAALGSIGPHRVTVTESSALQGSKTEAHMRVMDVQSAGVSAADVKATLAGYTEELLSDLLADADYDYDVSLIQLLAPPPPYSPVPPSPPPLSSGGSSSSGSGSNKDDDDDPDLQEATNRVDSGSAPQERFPTWAIGVLIVCTVMLCVVPVMVAYYFSLSNLKRPKKGAPPPDPMESEPMATSLDENPVELTVPSPEPSPLPSPQQQARSSQPSSQQGSQPAHSLQSSPARSQSLAPQSPPPAGRLSTASVADAEAAREARTSRPQSPHPGRGTLGDEEQDGSGGGGASYAPHY